jgi:hypothetical protein
VNDTSSNAFHQLRASVQRNCHLADAEHARDYSLCIYLLKMREYYRWEKGLALTQTISREDVGDWVMNREEFWDGMQEQEFQPIPVGTEHFDPFDEAGINDAIEADGLVYSSGFGRFGQAHFFLAKLESVRRFDGLTVYVSASEYARDLTAPPAMALGKRIFVRRESLRRSLWEMVDESRWSKTTKAITRALACYGGDGNGDVEQAIERMTDGAIDTLTWHETGEVAAGEDLDPRWSEMLVAVTGIKTELCIRAVRDHLADCLVTLPALLERGDTGLIHLYFANLQGMRKELFPRLSAAYDRWLMDGALGEFRDLIPGARAHWQGIAREMLAVSDQAAEGPDSVIDGLVAKRARY